jgi:hypothetical protein
MKYLGAWGTLIHEKNLKSKILCQTPFKQIRYSKYDLYVVVISRFQIVSAGARVWRKEEVGVGYTVQYTYISTSVDWDWEEMTCVMVSIHA